MIKIPVLTDKIQKAHAGEQGAVVDGEFIAFGATMLDVYRKAKELGYRDEEVLIAPIPRPGVVHV